MYIHYHYLNFASEGASHLAAVYNEAKVKQKYKESFNLLNTKVKELINNQLPENANIKDEQFFKLLEDFRNEVLSPAAEAMVQKIQTTGMSRTDLAQATENAEDIQRVINLFTKITQQITNSSFQENPLPVLSFDLIKGQNLSGSELKYKYREMYLANETTLKIDQSYSRAIARHQKDINSILANLSALKSISSGGMADFSGKVQSDTIKTLLWSTYFRLNKIVGFVSEDTLADIIPEYIVKKLNMSDKDFKIVAGGTGSSSMFSVRTEDVSVEMDLMKMLFKESEGKVKVTLPGITLKRTNIKNNNTARVHIKTNASFGDFLNKLDNTNEEEFYHAYADYNMALKDGSKGKMAKAQLDRASASGAMENMYNYMHAFMLPYALAGALEKNDLAYYMIINNKVYTIFEVLEKVVDEGNNNFVLSNIGSSQTGIKNAHRDLYVPETDPTSNEEGEKRSQNIIGMIQKLRIIMQLILKLN